ncbi:DUF3040 domain-containing protein [Lentzea albidocapillata]|uniref:DUF3040 domain-containing protein n=1 Tax=Lentzea albidocapillata TaxID=40571 RepID=A0A1W2FTI1_9PSEU|nr:DUF3040 domain-containing protein [Lentzea albidocapillata]SMD25241.1 Protein of unknown function [Lentzea albidocapillata]
MLSRHERQQLTAIERQFTASDPVLAQLLRSGPVPRKHRHRSLGVVAVYVLGVSLMMLGALAAVFSLIFMGALVLMVAACLHVTKSR